ncbi:DUF7282 domain-containing protein [Halogeometricum limi]|uniref:DUF7282 domain-containing protein n=1 Tax=Halogeometricum limi TaxID=555875 RepID=A0A1I6G7Q6_9EURY|nr:hypothetical protein [Halogeometricum limi]SFR38225.1 hypothetical protein SAMN04488124_0992 [Halogeometricum limi]
MQSTHTLTVLAAVLLLVAAGPTPALALANEHGAPSGYESARTLQTEASGSFGSDNVNVTRGDEVRFTVSHSGPANVTIGGPDYGYHLRIALGGSGTDEIVIDTYATTAADPDEYVDGGDATLLSPAPDAPIEPADYLMNVTVEGDERDLSTLTVEPRGEMSAESFVTPGSFGASTNTDADGNADTGELVGTMSPGTTVARGDYVVMKVHETGLETALEPDRLAGDAAANGIKLNVSQTAPGPNRQPDEYVATADPEANVSVYPSFEADTIYFVLDTSALDVRKQAARNEYEMRLTLTEENGLVESETTAATRSFTLVDPVATLSPSNDSVHYPWENESFAVEGTTTYAPNTTLEVRLRSPKPNAFLLISEATVDSQRRYRTTFDVGDVTRGVNATLWTDDVNSGDEFFLQTAQQVTLVAPNASVRFDDQSPDGATVTLSRVEVPEGGFVRIHDANGDGVGRSDYLAPGRHRNVSAELSLPLYDEQTLRAELVTDDGDEAYSRNDTAYERSGWVVNDTARVSFGAPPTETATPTPTPTATATPTATPTATTTPYPVRSETPLDPSDATSTGVSLSPAVAVVAILAAAGLVARRQGGDT